MGLPDTIHLEGRRWVGGRLKIMSLGHLGYQRRIRILTNDFHDNGFSLQDLDTIQRVEDGMSILNNIYYV